MWAGSLLRNELTWHAVIRCAESPAGTRAVGWGQNCEARTLWRCFRIAFELGGFLLTKMILLERKRHVSLLSSRLVSPPHCQKIKNKIKNQHPPPQAKKTPHPNKKTKNKHKTNRNRKARVGRGWIYFVVSVLNPVMPYSEYLQLLRSYENFHASWQLCRFEFGVLFACMWLTRGSLG